MVALKRALLVAAMLALAPCVALGGNANFGFTIKSESDGISSKFKRVWVSSVVPSSPAQSAGLLVGDAVLSINGKPVEALSAIGMRPLMQSLKPGDHLRLKVKRGNGAMPVIDIVAGTR
jgi:C-terminal processing protease CtpA/Prc